MSLLLPRFYRRQQEREDAAAVDLAVGEAQGKQDQGTLKEELTKPGDPWAMRGVPISAMGVPGTVPGTDPYAEYVRRWEHE